MALPKLDSYTPSEVSEARQACRAVDLYFNLLDKTQINFEDHLRCLRHERWLTAALAIFHDRASPKDICEFWSHAADELIQIAWKHFE